MPQIRKVEIENFRGVKRFSWYPSAGINCLIGPGDSGKSTILDAIDFCVSTRRNLHVTDADFFMLDVTEPIQITVTFGDLSDDLMSLESYGHFLRGFNADDCKIEDEPGGETETVISLRVTVEQDLEPQWELVSDREQSLGVPNNRHWTLRRKLAPTRIGEFNANNLAWRHGSVVSRLTSEESDVASVLADALRSARSSYGARPSDDLKTALEIVTRCAEELGVPVGDAATAQIDTKTVAHTGGSVSLHSSDGVPLSGLGTGSTRLLIAGLQKRVASQSSVVLIDELEYGLEPHRIIRLLDVLGAKDNDKPLQAFLTTHSPTALRELSAQELYVVRKATDCHEVHRVGGDDDAQGTIRKHPDAFLATSVIVCEGASEVGFLRGLDQYRSEKLAKPSLAAQGAALYDAGGGGSPEWLKRANVFQQLGYRVAILRDDDRKDGKAENGERGFLDKCGKVFKWRDGRCLETELFMSLSENAVRDLIKFAIEATDEQRVRKDIGDALGDTSIIDDICDEFSKYEISEETRKRLGHASSRAENDNAGRKKTAKHKRSGWFKQLSSMEYVARHIVGPDLENAELEFRRLIDAIFDWVDRGRS